jgi:AraC family ethanolamine operon transcriptional activator
MPIAIRQSDFKDFEVLRNAWQDAQFDIVQVENGPMRGALSHISFDGVGISTGGYSRGIRANGLGSDRRWVFSTQIDNGPAMMNRIQIKAGDQTIIRPDSEFNFANETGGQYAAVFVEPNELFDFIETRQPGATNSPLWREPLSVQAIEPQPAAERVEAYKLLINSLVRDGSTMSAETLEFHKRNIMELVTAPILDAIPYRRARLVAQDILIRDIRHYLTMAGSQPIHISQLCERFNIHPRALFRAFHDVMGIAPIQYLRTKRLNDIHTVLRRNGRAMTVQSVATAHGFLDLGRFSAAYRRMFGELPSQTLRRSMHAAVTVLFLSFVTIHMDFDYQDCDRDDYFVRPDSPISEPINHRSYDG